MAKRRGLEQRLAALAELRTDPSSDLAIEQLRTALGSKTNSLAARAAQIAGDFEIMDLEMDLVLAFERFMANPTKTDPGCQAKHAIADALYSMGSAAENVFLRGIRHVQMEPAWGGKVDIAAGLRGACALGLVRMNYPEVMVELAQLLADADRTARISAVRAIRYTGQLEGVPLLRFKVLSGDEDLEVLCECFGALLQLAPETSLSFVGDFIQDDDVALAEAAALALGESRVRETFGVLSEGWVGALDPGLRNSILQAMAMLHSDEAIDFLLSLIIEESPVIAKKAIAALGVYRHDKRLFRRVRQAVEERNDVDLSGTIEKMFE